MTHYHSLGVPEFASADDIRAAFRSLARTLHPDINRDPDAGERFALITAAYDILSDQAKRADYDRQLAARRTLTDPATPHYTWTNIADSEARAAKAVSDFDELYETFFAPREDEGQH